MLLLKGKNQRRLASGNRLLRGGRRSSARRPIPPAAYRAAVRSAGGRERLRRVVGDLRPSVGVEVRAVPAAFERSSPLASYLPSVDGSPATFHVNLSLPHPRRGVEALAFHEGFPGHHLQVQVELDRVRGAYRSLCHHAAFEEGWAVYAESLLAPSDAEARRGVVESELFRAARVVVDTGLHAFGWSRARAAAYLRRVCPFLPDEDVEMEVLRYMSDPGQACCYMVGLLAIRHLRDRGGEKDAAAFHRALLVAGSKPLSVLLSAAEEEALFKC